MALRRARIVCTLGPSSATTKTLRDLIDAGMDVARLNISHGTHEEHGRVIESVREASRQTGKEIAVLLDLQGPKIRTRRVAGGCVTLATGAAFVITGDDCEIGDEHRVGTTYPRLVREVAPGQTVLLDDGYLVLRIERIEGNDIVCTVVKGGPLRDHKGIVVPGAGISAPALSDKDIRDAAFGLSHGVDAVALSFVASEQDVIALRDIMCRHGRVVPIVAKIERWEGVTDIEDIVREADAVMVARGDLGLEMPPEEVPVLQKRIIARCNYHGKPVITATQMLESMITNPRPTRAEASDVANAVLDGSDCLMLSGETSVGRYPVESVRMMDAIIRKTEEHFPPSPREQYIPADAGRNIADAIGQACRTIALQTGAAAIVTLTSSGATAALIAKHRPRAPIIALTDNIDTLRKLSFTWGVSPRLIPPLSGSGDVFDQIAPIVLADGSVKRGDVVVFTAGTPVHSRAPTNMVKVVRL
ncbi:MAG: pyruvate kinase [Bacteroidota bacterium]|nr:pyruvate kinase [Bacteroidota bacterium]